MVANLILNSARIIRPPTTPIPMHRQPPGIQAINVARVAVPRPHPPSRPHSARAAIINTIPNGDDLFIVVRPINDNDILMSPSSSSSTLIHSPRTLRVFIKVTYMRVDGVGRAGQATGQVASEMESPIK